MLIECLQAGSATDHSAFALPGDLDDFRSGWISVSPGNPPTAEEPEPPMGGTLRDHKLRVEKIRWECWPKLSSSAPRGVPQLYTARLRNGQLRK